MRGQGKKKSLSQEVANPSLREQSVRIDATPSGRYAPAPLLATVFVIEASSRLTPSVAASLVSIGAELIRAFSTESAACLLRATTPDAVMISLGGPIDEGLRPGMDILAQLPTSWDVPTVIVTNGAMSAAEQGMSDRLGAKIVSVRMLRHLEHRSRTLSYLLPPRQSAAR
jgi:hypothetical protein